MRYTAAQSCLWAALLAPTVSAADVVIGESEAAGLELFEKKIRPALLEHCYQCHSAEVKEPKGGLVVDSRAGLHQGGDSGPAIVPRLPDESLLVRAVRYTDPDLRMPPKGKLPESVIADIEQWVALGAPDPRSEARPAAAATVLVNQPPLNLEDGRKFWAFQPPRHYPLPQVHDPTWPRGTIDQLILAKLEGRGIKPVADADRATLARRAYFDLVGLPPTAEEIDAFVNDPSPDALVRLVDRLLASPHFGERWGRHWLDIVRFAESSGGGRSLLFPDAWRYRDYVIESFNADRPYDRFVTEQIAGDLLPYSTADERYDQLVATAFLALGPTNYERQDKEILEMDVVDEQLDTMGRTLLGMTIGCARCHDHKFDPIPTEDYYALAGILKSTQTLVHDNVSRWVEQPLPMSAEQEAAVSRHDAEVAALQERIRLAKQAEQDGGADAAADSTALEDELNKLMASAPLRPVAMSVKDADQVADCSVCIRGNIHNRGATVPRGFLRVVAVDQPAALPAAASGRRELAAWLTSPGNPLTARVMANRVWQHLFGAGLVRTVDVFGTAGELPSHPELLDHLALRFVQQGWSVKQLIREIVLSRTYQLSSARQAEALAVDPENRLLWRMNRRRLDAEAIRDSILAASGRLDRTLGGPQVRPGTSSEYDYEFHDCRRSAYTPILRNRLLELFEAFDFADPNLVVGRRNISTVATQALYLMNGSFVWEQARHAAQRALLVPGLDDAGRVERAYRTALGRPPSPAERHLALAFVARAGERAPPEQRLAVWEQFYQTLFACVDFRYVY